MNGGRPFTRYSFSTEVFQCVFFRVLIIAIALMQVETILLSIIAMLSSPNDESPANIDAAVCSLSLSSKSSVVGG